MKLAQVLDRESICEDLQARDRHGALRELTGRLAEAGIAAPVEEILRLLEKREDIESTGIGEGVAIPHARLKDFPGIRLIVGRSRAGVDFHAGDERPVRLFFVLISSESVADEHLRALARISRLAREPAFRRALLAADGRDDIFGILAREDEKN